MTGIMKEGGADKRAWVVFTGRTELPLLRLLRPGFRHCYVILHDGKTWMSIDPLSHVIEVENHHHLDGDFNLPNWLCSQGFIVVPAPITRGLTRCAPIMLFTCVEASKRILGIHNRWILTPFQLYKHLIQEKVISYV